MGVFTNLEQLKFCLNARGSLEELIDDLNVCEDESYLPAAEVDTFKQQGWRVHKVLAGYMRWLRERKQGAALSLREDSPTYGWTNDQFDELIDEDDRAFRFNASTLQRLNLNESCRYVR